MKAFLSHESALQFYRGRKRERRISKKLHTIPDGFVPSLTDDEGKWLQREFGITLPVQTTVANNDNRRRKRNLHSAAHSSSICLQSYYHVGRDLYIATPELTLAQVAGRLASSSVGDAGNAAIGAKGLGEKALVLMLAYLGSELSGNYILTSGVAEGFVEGDACLELGRLDELLTTSGRFPGKKLLAEARRWMMPSAKSPAELQMALFASLPKSYGGAGLPLPLLNEELDMRYGKNTLKRRPDALFEEAKLIMEYNGGYHEGERADDDDERRNELIDRGYKVLVVNKRQLHDAVLLDLVLRTAARDTGSSGRAPRDWERRRAEMRSIVFELCGTRCRENSNMRLPCVLRPPK